MFCNHQLRGVLLVPLGHGGVIQPSCATLGGLLPATLWLGEKFIAKRAIGALIIVCGLVVIGAEAVIAIGVHGVAGDLIFVLTGLMFATFGTRSGQAHLSTSCRYGYQRAVIARMPAYWALGGFNHMITLDFGKLPAGGFAGCAGVTCRNLSVRLFHPSVSAGRAAVFPSLVPPFVLLIDGLRLVRRRLPCN